MSSINLFAFCLPLVIFLFWGIVGYAALSLLRTQRNTLQNFLLAPTFGIAITLLCIISLNRLNLPIIQFATSLTIGLLLASGGILFWKKPLFPMRRYLPFFGIFLLALILIGYPLLKFGFDWVSYSNDDMANYSLGALRFLHNAYYAYPNVDNMLLSKDYTGTYWFMYVMNNHRAGSELILAWVSGVTHLLPIQIFMPVILALHLTLISVSSAMILVSKRWYHAAIAGALLITFSALITLGATYQLIAQVGGLSLLIAGVIFLLQPFTLRYRYRSLKQGILIAIILSALLVYYPEIVPFFALSFFLYVAVRFLKGWRPQATFYLTLGVSALAVIIILNHYLIGAVEFLLHQTHSGQDSVKDLSITLFPYYLMPSGLANFWGIQAIGVYYYKEPWMSLAILMGATISIIAVIAILKLLWRKQVAPAAAVAFVMLCFALLLFFKKADFGLFKITMYMQPFVIVALTIFIFEVVKNKHYRMIFFTLLIICSVKSQFYYVARSEAVEPGGLAEITFASNLKINEEYKKLISTISSDSIILSDNFNLSLLKFEAFNSYGKRFIFFTHTVFHNIQPEGDKNRALMKTPTELALFDRLSHKFSKQNFILDNSKQPPLVTSFLEPIYQNPTHSPVYLITDIKRTVLNKNEIDPNDSHNFFMAPLSHFKNHLIFISSSLGPIYFAPGSREKDTATLHNVEGDVFYPGQFFQAIKRYLLFRIINPTKTVRLELNITNTLQNDGDKKLPSAATVIGQTRVPFTHLMGHGSANVFSQPITPKWINGSPYILVDMNDEGKKFRNVKSRLMRLYGVGVYRDLRKVVVFSRNISLVSEEQYNNLKAPSLISHFPADLAMPALEYSGIYEDGMISDNAFFKLTQPSPNSKLIIKGSVPETHPTLSPIITVTVDGRKMLEKQLTPGNFTIQLNVLDKKERHEVKLHFNKTEMIAVNKPVAAKIERIGFENIAKIN